MAVTIQDVAKKAGVSHTTVSWVIHNDPRITRKTKDKVLKAIKELDYHPNLHARSLVQGKTNTIAIVAGVLSTSFETHFLKGVEKYCFREDIPHDLVLFSLMGDMKTKGKVLKDILYGNRADGVILVNLTVDNEILEIYKKNKIPLILVEEEGEGAHVLITDNRKGAEEAVSFLIGRGKKEIALVVSDPDDPHSSLSPRERILGYKDALKKGKMPIKESNIFLTEEYYFEKGAQIYQELIKKIPALDGIFCASGDALALGIMKEAISQGKKIPSELAIIGYDNLDIASMSSPALSSVDQPIEQMGEDAIKLAIASLKGEIEFQSKVYPPRLIARESS